MKINMNKKLRYGGISVIFTAAFIAAVVIFNVVFSALANKYLWYIDTTPEPLFTLSEACVDLLDDIEGHEVSIIFCDDPDNLEAAESTRLVYNTARELADKLDYVKVKNINIIKNPSAVNKYKITPSTNIKTTDVIIESGSEFRRLSVSTFYITNKSSVTWAYNAEAKFASTIIAVTRAASPICAFLTNHRETAADTELVRLVEEAGYEFMSIDLTKDEIPEDCRLMISYNPIQDFMTSTDGISEISEIDKLDRWLDEANSFMVFVSPNTPVLPNLEEYLYEWGIVFDRYTDENGNTFGKMIKDKRNSLTDDGFQIVAEYVDTENSLGALVTSDLTNAGTMPKVVFPDAMPIRHANNYDDKGMYSSNGYTRNISDIFVTGETATVEANGETVGRATSADRFPFLTITSEGNQLNASATSEFSYVMACGSTDFASEKFLQTNVIGNRDALYSMFKMMQKEIVYIDLPFIPISGMAIDIEILEAYDANAITAVLAILPAAIVFVSGMIVMARRKSERKRR